MVAKLKINGKSEIYLSEGVYTIGRGQDNFVSFAEDSSVSKYHAEIEERNGDFWLIDLGSSNGTTVNGKSISPEVRLKDGDTIVFGDSAEAEFNPSEHEEIKVDAPVSSATSESSTTVNEPNETTDETPAPRSKAMIGVAAATVGLAVVSLGVVGWMYLGGSSCDAIATITSPQDGETISKAANIEIETTNSKCVAGVTYVLNGEEVATVRSEPFSSSLDPDQFPDLADGGTYDLQVILIDAEGNKVVQANPVSLAFETIAEEPKQTPEIVQVDDTPKVQQKNQGKQISLAETQEMSNRLMKQFSGNFKYKFDPQFLTQVQAKTNEFKTEGFFANAQKFDTSIRTAFVLEQNLDVPLGYILAMSRSKFDPKKQGNDEGLWRMSNDFATANAYNGTCGSEPLSDPSQNCAAKATAVYLKALILNVFEGDIVYGISSFGMSPNEASAWKQILPTDRSNFWQVIKNQKQKDEIVRFFAAGIVAENPQRFGLKRDRPISEIYKNMMY
jgi:pSer/pThr/pTyr-binding forkhead associated (FHA) protein